MSLIKFLLKSEDDEEMPDEIPFKEDSALDLLEKMLKLDHQDRVGLSQLIDHEFFRDIKKM